MQLIEVIGFNRILKVDYFYKRVIAVTVWFFTFKDCVALSVPHLLIDKPDDIRKNPFNVVFFLEFNW